MTNLSLVGSRMRTRGSFLYRENQPRGQRNNKLTNLRATSHPHLEVDARSWITRGTAVHAFAPSAPELPVTYITHGANDESLPVATLLRNSIDLLHSIACFRPDVNNDNLTLYRPIAY